MNTNLNWIIRTKNQLYINIKRIEIPKRQINIYLNNDSIDKIVLK